MKAAEKLPWGPAKREIAHHVSGFPKSLNPPGRPSEEVVRLDTPQILSRYENGAGGGVQERC